jgi:hypothetical protein
MKRFLLLCCLVAASTTYVQAQHESAPPLDVAAPVSVSDFSSKVKELNKQLGKGDATAADKTFADIDQMVHAELKVVRYKMRDAANKEEVTKYGELTQKQRMLFAKVLEMKRKSMMENKAEIVQKLNELAELFI